MPTNESTVDVRATAEDVYLTVHDGARWRTLKLTADSAYEIGGMLLAAAAACGTDKSDTDNNHKEQ